MPTWLTGLLVVTWIARSAALLPRNSHRSPVRVSSTAPASDSRGPGVAFPRPLGTVGSLGSMRWWKLLGLAGLVGVAATGVVVTRSARQRTAYTPDEVRARLLARHAEAEARGTES